MGSLGAIYYEFFRAIYKPGTVCLFAFNVMPAVKAWFRTILVQAYQSNFACHTSRPLQ